MNKTTNSLSEDSLIGRIKWFQQKLWSGSQSRMAADLGVSQGALSNVLLGKRSPGPKILSALAAHPVVNADWLTTGDGDALLTRPEQSGIAEIGLPVAKQLFFGLPFDHPSHLEDYLYPVRRKLFRPSRYWVEIDASSPLCADKHLKIGAGDHVLFEPDAEGWPADTRGYPCIVLGGRGKKKWLAFGKLVKTAQQVRDADDVELLGTDLSGARDDSQDKVPGSDRFYRVTEIDSELFQQPARHVPGALKVAAVGIYRCGGFGS